MLYLKNIHLSDVVYNYLYNCKLSYQNVIKIFVILKRFEKNYQLIMSSKNILTRFASIKDIMWIQKTVPTKIINLGITLSFCPRVMRKYVQFRGFLFGKSWSRSLESSEYLKYLIRHNPLEVLFKIY